MTQDFTICVGTVGAGLWYSSDSGERWKRSKMELPFFNRANDIQVRTLVVSPHNPHTIFGGSEVGLYRSDDNGINFTLLESQAEDKGEHRRNQAHAELYDILGIRCQMTLGQNALKKHPRTARRRRDTRKRAN